MAEDGHGTTIVFGTTGWAPNLVSVDGPAAVRAAIPASHMGTTVAHAKVPEALYDAGELELTIEHDASETIPLDQPAEQITIDWAGSANTWVFSGFLIGYNGGAAIGERMEASVTIAVTGAITGL